MDCHMKLGGGNFYWAEAASLGKRATGLQRSLLNAMGTVTKVPVYLA